MKTAGQEFLEWYNNYVKQYGCSPSDYDVNYFWEHNYLELEKQQIIDFTNDFIDKHTFGDYDGIVQKNKSVDGYYNETFKNK
jgi:hypothetical protein